MSSTCRLQLRPSTPIAYMQGLELPNTFAPTRKDVIMAISERLPSACTNSPVSIVLAPVRLKKLCHAFIVGRKSTSAEGTALLSPSSVPRCTYMLTCKRLRRDKQGSGGSMLALAIVILQRTQSSKCFVVHQVSQKVAAYCRMHINTIRESCHQECF